MKIITVIKVCNEKTVINISRVCACVRTSAEDDTFPGGGGGGNLMILFNLRVFMFWFDR